MNDRRRLHSAVADFVIGIHEGRRVQAQVVGVGQIGEGITGVTSSKAVLQKLWSSRKKLIGIYLLEC